MGTYTDNLYKRRKTKMPKQRFSGEYLVSCAIKRGDTVNKGFKAHWELRASLGDEAPEKPLAGDINGFFTSEGRFVDRDEAKLIADVAGQANVSMRELLSSDINWWTP